MFTLLHPERVLGIATIGAPLLYQGRLSQSSKNLPEGFYIHRFRVSALTYILGLIIDKHCLKFYVCLLIAVLSTARNLDEQKLILVGLMLKRWWGTSTFSSPEVKYQLLLKTRKSWIWSNLLLPFPLGSLRKILQHMEHCTRNLVFRQLWRFHTGNEC